MKAGLDVTKLREAEESMEELKRLATRLRETVSQHPEQDSSEELVAAASKLDAAANELLKTIQEYRKSIQ